MRQNEIPGLLRTMDQYIARMERMRGQRPPEITLTRDQMRAFRRAVKEHPGELTEGSYRGIPLREVGA